MLKLNIDKHHRWDGGAGAGAWDLCAYGGDLQWWGVAALPARAQRARCACARGPTITDHQYRHISPRVYAKPIFLNQ